MQDNLPAKSSVSTWARVFGSRQMFHGTSIVGFRGTEGMWENRLQDSGTTVQRWRAI